LDLQHQLNEARKTVVFEIASSQHLYTERTIIMWLIKLGALWLTVSILFLQLLLFRGLKIYVWLSIPQLFHLARFVYLLRADQEEHRGSKRDIALEITEFLKYLFLLLYFAIDTFFALIPLILSVGCIFLHLAYSLRLPRYSHNCFVVS